MLVPILYTGHFSIYTAANSNLWCVLITTGKFQSDISGQSWTHTEGHPAQRDGDKVRESAQNFLILVWIFIVLKCFIKHFYMLCFGISHFCFKHFPQWQWGVEFYPGWQHGADLHPRQVSSWTHIFSVSSLIQLNPSATHCLLKLDTIFLSIVIDYLF